MRVTPWLACLTFGACGTGEGVSYIVLDPAARAALIEAETGGRHHTGALPLEVEGEEIELVGPSGRLWLPIAANRAYQVDGAGRAREWVLGEEVRTDVVEVSGPEAAVRNLAWALGARAPQSWNGRWRLEGQDALVRLSWMGDLADISEVALVLTDQGRARTRSDLDPTADLPPTRPLRTDEGLEALVGLYTSDAGTLFLDAEGGFSLQKACDPAPVIGTYRRSASGIRLYGTDLALTVTESGRLEAPGLVFSGGDEP